VNYGGKGNDMHVSLIFEIIKDIRGFSFVTNGLSD
jgi:hypothetical protein